MPERWSGLSAFAFVRDGNLLSASLDGLVRVRDLKKGEMLSMFSERRKSVLSLAIDSSGWIMSGSLDMVKFWRLNSSDGRCESVGTLAESEDSVWI